MVSVIAVVVMVLGLCSVVVGAGCVGGRVVGAGLSDDVVLVVSVGSVLLLVALQFCSAARSEVKQVTGVVCSQTAST